MNKNILMETAVSACLLTFVIAWASDSQEAVKPAASDQILLDKVIGQEIETRTNALKKLGETLATLDMAHGEAMDSRVDAFRGLMTLEIDFLVDLKVNGTVSAKKGYCRMVLGQRLITNAFGTQFKCDFGDKCEAIPKALGRKLTDDQVEGFKTTLTQTIALKKQVDGITTFGTVP